MKKFLTVWMMAAVILLIAGNRFCRRRERNRRRKNEGVFVEPASTENGGTLVADGAIPLVFSKNVANSKVAEGNRALFRVVGGNQSEVTIEIVMADDQVEPDKKNDVVIQFPQGLADGTYTLTAQKGVTSKSGGEKK